MLDETAFDTVRVHDLKKPVIIDSLGYESHVRRQFLGNSFATCIQYLARTEIAVGYHSGSHYSALQALEVFLSPEDIALKFVGSSWSRVDAALARKIPAVNVWGPQLYLLEQHGFRRIVSTTFMMAFLFHREVDEASVQRYMRALIRAQADIDVEPERYKHYFINEIPERFRDKVDVRRFGVGERMVPQAYTQAMFEKTQAWMHARKLFDAAPDGGVSYGQVVDIIAEECFAVLPESIPVSEVIHNELFDQFAAASQIPRAPANSTWQLPKAILLTDFSYPFA
jgi:hypothetical protein